MKYLVDYIVVFFNWLINLFVSVFQLLWDVILILIECAEFLVNVISSLPTVLTVATGALVICCVLYKILGREGGES